MTKTSWRLLRCLPCLLTTILVSSGSLYAQEPAKEKAPVDEKAAETKPAAEAPAEDDTADDTKPAPEPPVFQIPDGTIEELQAFINTIKRTRPKPGAKATGADHFRLQVKAVLTTCDKILASEPEEAAEVAAIKEKLAAYRALGRVDPAAAETGRSEVLDALEADQRPVIAALLRAQKMLARVAKLNAMSADEQSEFVSELFEMIEENGLTRDLYSTANSVAQAVARKNPETGGEIYEQLANFMADSDDEALSSRAEKTRGAARRVRLPGNFMEVKGRTADGEEFDWKSYRGKVVLVDFWASWCGPCRGEIPNMKAQLENYGDRGFAIVGVNLDSSKEKYQAYVDAEELTWTNLMSDKPEEMGWNNPLATHYGISGIPTAILVDKEGKVVSMSARGSRLNTLLEDLLGPVPPKDDSKGDTLESDEPLAEESRTPKAE